MTAEELLIPRYVVIGEYPDSNFDIGDILTPDRMNPTFFCDDKKIPSALIEKPEKYPHLFRELNWWEYRKEEERPKYLKHNVILDSLKGLLYHKIDSWYVNSTNIYCFFNEGGHYAFGPWSDPKRILPISEEEYLKNVSND